MPVQNHLIIRHFSHVTKSCIFKNLSIRRTFDRNFRGNLLEYHFKDLKLYSNSPSWLARSACHMSTFWKTASWISHFWQDQHFRFCCARVHDQKRLEFTKASISTYFKALACPETKILVYFLRENVYIRKICTVKAKGFWFKN